MTLYTIESIRKKSGGPHEREARRKGHRTRIDNITPGAPMIFTYVDDGEKYVMTTSIQNVVTDGGKLVVFTRNTVYTFRKIPEVSE